jgi:hypothetical protein
MGKKFTFIFIFFKNKLYMIIRLHNLKSDTDIAQIEPHKAKRKKEAVSNVTGHI